MATDLVVLGGGVAGTAAALAARAAGARVTVVHAGPGASALAAGGWRGEPPAAFVAALAATGHPLVRVPGEAQADLSRADGTRAGGGGALPHVAGILDPADFAPPWHAGALPLAECVVCGVRGLPAMRAAFLARAWRAPPLVAVQLELPDTLAAGWSPVALAAAVERAPARLGEAVGRRARELGVTRVLLPTILGLEDPQATWRTAAAAAGVELAEALGGLPSLPGWRLERALRRALAAAGVERIEARAVGALPDGAGSGRVAGVKLADGRALPAGAVVLATGKFVAGGIAAAPGLREPALGLPVWLDRLGERFREAAPLLTTELARTGVQPLLAAGIRADARGRPTGERGELVLENVRVAGAVRSGVDTAALGLGAAAADGWRMALSALEAA